MYILNVSQIEYQGISIIPKDCREIQNIVNQYYRNVPVRANLHLCLKYFGNTKKIDTCIEKQDDILPASCIGKPVSFPIIGIGEYRKNGKIMNVALLVDTSCFVGIAIKDDKTLYDYLDNECPNITVYTRPGIWVDEKGRTRPITAVKKSVKCFLPEQLETGETQRFIPFDIPVTITGQLAVFNRQNVAYHVNMDAPRLVTKKAINETVNEIMTAEFTQEKNEQADKKIEQAEEDLFK